MVGINMNFQANNPGFESRLQGLSPFISQQVIKYTEFPPIKL